MQCLWEPEESIKCPEAGNTGNYEPCEIHDWKDLGPLEKQKIFLTTELSVQPHYFDFLIYVLPGLIQNSKRKDEEG